MSGGSPSISSNTAFGTALLITKYKPVLILLLGDVGGMTVISLRTHEHLKTLYDSHKCHDVGCYHCGRVIEKQSMGGNRIIGIAANSVS